MKYLNLNGLIYLWNKINAKINTKQDTLVSGTNIKTVNNKSILGSGNATLYGTDILLSDEEEATIYEGIEGAYWFIITEVLPRFDNKQDNLVSGTNIKTVNGTSVLGSGNISTPNTTYSEIPTAEITAGTSTTARAITGRRSQEIVNKARTGLVAGNANANNIVSNVFVGTQAQYDALPNKTGILAIIEE